MYWTACKALYVSLVASRRSAHVAMTMTIHHSRYQKEKVVKSWFTATQVGATPNRRVSRWESPCRICIHQNNRKNLRERQPPRGRQEEPYKVNQKIRAREVRVVGDFVEGGNEVLPLEKAIKLALDNELDLVEISPTTNPPVCKILDYAKFKYEQKKKQKEIKANAAKVVLKEIRFGPNTDDHDFNFKLKHAISFLKEGAKVKAYVHFVGRSIVFKERGEMLLLKFAQALEDYGIVEQMPKLEGKRMNIFIAPKPGKK